jgi:ubiquitin carboxyl-terminal hydrolase 5/13
VNWVPTKLDIPINLPPSDNLSLDKYIGEGLQATEVELPEDKPGGDTLLLCSESVLNLCLIPEEPSGLPAFNAEAMAQLEGMGFPTVRCQKALLATGNADPTAAMDWLFTHMEDPGTISPRTRASYIANRHTGIDDPITVGVSSSKGPEPSPEQVAMLSDMGFAPAQARKALRETVSSRPFTARAHLMVSTKGGDTERAVEWLFNHPDDTGEDVTMGDAPEGSPSTAKELPGTKRLPATYRLKAFISHKGPSVHSGHYVVHIKHPGLVPRTSTETVDGEPEEGWVLFNDEKVVKADKESVRDLKRLAYLYIFEKV